MRVAVLALLAMNLAGCGNDSVMGKLGLGRFGVEGKIHDAARAGLIDPDSAKFGKLTVIGKLACLTVNSKNAFGGYAGDQQAVLLETEGKWEVVNLEKATHDTCLKVIQKVVDEGY